IVYTFRVANTGNVTLFDVAVDDDRIAALVPEPLDQLTPGVTAIVEAAPYTVVPGDVTGRPLVNIASAIGTLPDGATVIESDDDDATLPTLAMGMADTGREPGAAGAIGILALLLGLVALGVDRGVRRRRLA